MTAQPSPSLTPPATPVYTTVATPDRGFDSTVTCRGGVYGDVTVVGFRIITERDPSRDIEAGVAVEIKKTRDDIAHGRIVDAVEDILSGRLLNVAHNPPQFIQVPNPQDTVLYLTAQQTDQGEINILTEVKELFEREHNRDNPLRESQIPDHVPYHGMRMPSREERAIPEATSRVFELTRAFRVDLETQNVFPNWRNYLWSHLEAIVLKSLLPAEGSGRVADNVKLFAEALTAARKDVSLTGVQREKVLLAYCAVAEVIAQPREVLETVR